MPLTMQPGSAIGPYTTAVGGTQDPNVGIYEAQRRRLQAGRDSLTAQGNYLSLQSSLYGPQENVYAARTRALQARQRVNQQQSQYTGMSQQELQQRMAEEQALQAAAGNTTDILTTAERNMRRRGYYSRWQAGGIQPIEVNLPEGQQSNVAGVFATDQTQLQRLTQSTQQAQAIRALNLQMARTALEQTGNDSQAVQLLADQAGIDLDHAEMLVARARLPVQEAALNQDWATQGVNEAQFAPGPGVELYTDPTSGVGRWVSPAEADRLTRRYQQSYANEAPVYGAGDFSSFSTTYLLSLLDVTAPDGNAIVRPAEVLTELQLRGYSQQQAQMMIDQKLGTRAGAVGGSFQQPAFGGGDSGSGVATAGGPFEDMPGVSWLPALLNLLVGA